MNQVSWALTDCLEIQYFNDNVDLQSNLIYKCNNFLIMWQHPECFSGSFANQTSLYKNTNGKSLISLQQIYLRICRMLPTKFNNMLLWFYVEFLMAFFFINKSSFMCLLYLQVQVLHLFLAFQSLKYFCKNVLKFHGYWGVGQNQISI